MTKAASIHEFWSSFGLTAYEENTVPYDAAFPYITYQLVTGSFGQEVQAAASLWYFSESWVDINAKTEEVSQEIGLGGKIIKCDEGRIWIKRGSPFAQNMGDEGNDLIRRKALNISIEYLTAH